VVSDTALPIAGSCRILAGLGGGAQIDGIRMVLTAQNKPLMRCMTLFEYFKADCLDIGGSDTEAVAFLLPDLRHAEVF